MCAIACHVTHTRGPLSGVVASPKASAQRRNNVRLAANFACRLDQKYAELQGAERGNVRLVAAHERIEPDHVTRS